MEISTAAHFGWGLSRVRGGGELQPITNYWIKHVRTPISKIAKWTTTHVKKKFIFFFSILELGKCMWVLLFHLLLFLKFLKGEGFILDEVFFFLEKERGAWVYLFTIFFVNFFIIYILLSYFLPLKGGGWHRFYFSPFLLFFVLCVKLLLPLFTLARGRGCGFFSILLLLLFFKIFLVLFLLFEGWKGAWAF